MLFSQQFFRTETVPRITTDNRHCQQTWNNISLWLDDIAQNERKRQLVLSVTWYDRDEELDRCRLNLQLLFTAHKLRHPHTNIHTIHTTTSPTNSYTSHTSSVCSLDNSTPATFSFYYYGSFCLTEPYFVFTTAHRQGPVTQRHS